MSYCDVSVEFTRVITVKKTRKVHICCECLAPIPIGSEAVRASGKCEGDMWQEYQHILCAEACEYVRDVINKDLRSDERCLMFGELFEADTEGTSEQTMKLQEMKDEIERRAIEYRKQVGHDADHI